MYTHKEDNSVALFFTVFEAISVNSIRVINLAGSWHLPLRAQNVGLPQNQHPDAVMTVVETTATLFYHTSSSTKLAIMHTPCHLCVFPLLLWFWNWSFFSAPTLSQARGMHCFHLKLLSLHSRMPTPHECAFFIAMKSFSIMAFLRIFSKVAHDWSLIHPDKIFCISPFSQVLN